MVFASTGVAALDNGYGFMLVGCPSNGFWWYNSWCYISRWKWVVGKWKWLYMTHCVTANNSLRYTRDGHLNPGHVLCIGESSLQFSCPIRLEHFLTLRMTQWINRNGSARNPQKFGAFHYWHCAPTHKPFCFSPLGCQLMRWLRATGPNPSVVPTGLHSLQGLSSSWTRKAPRFTNKLLVATHQPTYRAMRAVGWQHTGLGWK